MKKFSIIVLLIFSVFSFTACMEDEEFDLSDTEGYNQGGSDNNSSNGGNNNQGNNNSEDTGDSGYNQGENQDDHNDPGYNQDPTNPTEPTDPTNPTEPTEPTNPTDPTNPTEPTEPTNPTDPTEPQQQCTGLSIDWSSLTTDNEYPGVYYYTDADDNPYVSFEFVYSDNSTVKTGTFDLGSGLNTNYKTCTECVRIIRDHEDFFFQTSGTLKIDSVDASNNIKGSLSAKFVEVTIAPKPDYTSTPVPGGECFEIQSAFFDNTTGGGTTTDCTNITLGSITMSDETDPDYDFYEYTASYSPNSSSYDEFLLQLINNNYISGEYDLAGTNYADEAGIFLLVFTNDDKIYFQQSGKINFTNFNSASGKFSANLDSIKLQQVTIAPNPDYTSTPVEGGGCLKITNTTISY